jgi:threonine dehydrogenase-like Zn-dependent dehydrogenase
MDFRAGLACIFRASGSASHTMYDTALNPANPAATVLYASTAGGEDTYSAVDILSNGIKVRAPGPSGALNTSAAVYALAAWAGTPGKFTRAR